ncbi:response regulator receiver modulated diguanylate cyclase/phosphodiesterase [Malonomonas rubra DSM 5091]|uniref:Response regulator receiver modulated diguanylate cyclase/phosphodiesterase n=1 Tax=Malonomonas rubra DSM 5091 TaxID=1122189 RepID=A0A1M6NDU0_MALRU|nr:EAL domain-containing protein [Malonomonas rubra]SHJ93908.1 response regulator receiver modulated diguanylate cyclase/phosphodiesterase [Malonomonas rubra DSM 5091]
MLFDKSKSNPRVLVVDDNFSIHADFKKILVGNDPAGDDLHELESSLFGEATAKKHLLKYDVDFASQGQEALEMVIEAEKQEKPYSVAFIDGRMPPGWDGIETIKNIWKVSPALQVVLCTAYADYSWDEIQKSLGETDSLVILKKPFDNVEVMQLAHALSCKWAMSREIEGRLHQLAYYDSLTGLPNRDHFLTHLNRSLDNGNRGALFFIDLDNFKRINDTLGHSAGDDLLEIVARRLSQCVRSSISDRPGSLDSANITARLGGDEFAVLVDRFDTIDSISAIAKRIINTISKPIELDQHQVLVTPSIGISIFPDDGSHISDILKNADLAMYFSKRNGSNSFNYYQQSMNADALKRLTVEQNLRIALDSNELSLAYQPQIDLGTGKLSGFEALLRWNSQELGQVPPMEFIPVAEECGLMIPIGDWVIKTACQQAKEWIDDGLSIPRIGVNVSICQFTQANFLETVREILNETCLPAEFLQIEITESLLLSKTVNIAKTLKGLNELGVQIAIDDFGTGYSNLSRLKEMPINQLKIDRSFVCGIDDNLKNRSILTAIIAMASGIDLGVIAEGVETDGQLGFLKNEECDEVQGFLISYPMNKEMASEYLKTKVFLPT